MAWYLMIYDPREDWRTIRVNGQDISMPVGLFNTLPSKIERGLRWVQW